MTHPTFVAYFPRSSGERGLKLRPVSTGNGVSHPGFDAHDVKQALGEERFAKLEHAITSGTPYSGSVFSCGHRKDESGVEVHCIYASDLEQFLESEAR